MAAGTGERMNYDIPKQFIEINGLPILAHTYNVFKEIKNISIYIVLPMIGFEKWSQYMSKFIDKGTKLIKGGEHRNKSVRNGINAIPSRKGFIGIHDGVRPFLSADLVNNLFNEAESHGNAIPYTNTINSMRKIDGNNNFSVDRTQYVQIQTPQIFKINVLRESLNKIKENNYTDEASLIERLEIKINLVKGEEKNIKITTEGDLNYFN